MRSKWTFVIEIFAFFLASSCERLDAVESRRSDDDRSPVRLPGQVKHNPPYDPVDIRAALARGNQPSDPAEMPFLLANHARVVDSLMNPDVRPPDSLRVYFVITLNRDGLLTLRLDEHRQAVLVFTSEGRAKHYLTEVRDLELEGEVGAVNFSANDWVSMVQSWLGAGMAGLLIDKCPYCEEDAVFGLSSDKKKDDWVTLCAVVKATRILQYNFYLNEATMLLAKGHVLAARQMAEHIVTYIDAERPEVHLLLARCGIEDKDDDLVRRKRVVLEFFGPEWLGKLDGLRK